MHINGKTLVTIYGGFWGSEGKGQIAAKISQGLFRHFALRVGGPNAGHTIYSRFGEELKLQQIPVGTYVNEECVPIIGASAVIDQHILLRELEWLNKLYPAKPVLLYVDGKAAVITHEMQAREKGLMTEIGSTGEGVGAATADKVMRRAKLVRDMEPGFFGEFGSRVRIVNTVDYLGDDPMGYPVILEGTQGYLLSLNHSPYYPFTTSRDCGPEDMLSQSGLSSRAYAEHITICVMRTYPIRVGGNSGPLPNEVTWEQVMDATGGYVKEPERTTVTKKIRRIATWNDAIAHMVARRTRPSHVAITFLDYEFPDVAGARHMRDLSSASLKWLEAKQRVLGCPIRWVSCGKGQEHSFEVTV